MKIPSHSDVKAQAEQFLKLLGDVVPNQDLQDLADFFGKNQWSENRALFAMAVMASLLFKKHETEFLLSANEDKPQ
jgi:hypothetical protein